MIHQQQASFRKHHESQQESPPFVTILMGDNIYAKDSFSLEEAYREIMADSNFATLRHSSLMIATMDDNDYTEDLELGKIAFLDMFEQASSNDVRRQPGRGIYDSHTWNCLRGKDDLEHSLDDRPIALQIILLDVRYHATTNDWLGDAQWTWLQRQLEQEQVVLRLVVSPIQILPTAHPWDCWNTRPEARQRLLRMILENGDKNSTTTILLSGDRHVAAMYQHNSLLEVTSSSLTHSVKRPSCLDDEFDPVHQINPYSYENNFGELVIDWHEKTAEVSIRSVETREKLQTFMIPF